MPKCHKNAPSVKWIPIIFFRWEALDSGDFVSQITPPLGKSSTLPYPFYHPPGWPGGLTQGQANDVHKCNSPICRFKLFPLISSMWNMWHWPVHNAHLRLMLASSNVTCFYIQGAVYSTREKDKTTSDVTDAMLLVKNKSIALLWELNSIFM